MAATALQEELMPAGGIADFIFSDEELDALEEAETEQTFGTQGIAEFKPIARKMASYGRYGDDHIVHAETGELVVPKMLIDQSPELKESIFSHLREMGIEEPERFVVGSDANSLNPMTGMPEFWNPLKQVRKAVSNIGKGVSKAFKSVGKVLKKVAPIVLPIVGTALFGPIYGAALGSGISTLIQGGNIKDAFKSALISGGIGALGAGVTSKLGGGGFMEGVKNAGNTANLKAGFDSLGRAATGDFSGFSMSNMKAGPASEGGTAYIEPPSTGPLTTEAAREAAMNVQTASQYPVSPSTDALTTPTSSVSDAQLYDSAMSGSANTLTTPTNPLTTPTTDVVTQNTLTPPAGDVVTQSAYEPKGFLQNLSEGNISEAFLPSGPTPEQVAAQQASTYNKAYQTAISNGSTPAVAENIAKTAMSKVTASSMGPGLIASYGPLAAAGTAGAAALGFFDTPPEEDPEGAEDFELSGEDLIKENPDEYLISGIDPVTGQVIGLDPKLASDRNFLVESSRQLGGYGGGTRGRTDGIFRAAAGGQVYPRRNGGIMPNEGTPNRDSVRALLMPGEFVMTKDAVRGLGNGSLNNGIQNMYSMMRGLETKGRRMA